MRTTISIDDHVLEATKKLALESKRTLGEVIEEGLRIAYFTGSKRKGTTKVRPIKTYRGTGTFPGVDLLSSADLLEVMEDS